MNDAFPSNPPERKYAVFISYRHADNREQGRQWATWLHHTLETYEVPPDLVGRTNLRGEPVPASLYPVFRDEEELPADADLSANIQRALRHSALLVVLCSPRAVESRFVADEIKVFKELGKAGHILALMIDGEPNATDDPGKVRVGIRPEHECLPEPLRYGVPRSDGSIDWTQRTEPIAADVRPENKPVQGWTTAAAYREELTRQGFAKPEIDRLSTAYELQLELATMMIIAGAIGLPLAEVMLRYTMQAESAQLRFSPGQIWSPYGSVGGVLLNKAAALYNLEDTTPHTYDPETGQFSAVAPEVVPPNVDENIQFTVFRPEEAPPDVWCDLLAFAHLDSKRPDGAADERDPLEEVERQARQFLGDQLENYKQLTQDSSVSFPQDGEITFVPELEHAEFNPPRVTFLWKESVHREAFRFRITSGAPGTTVRGCVNVFLGPFLAATVTLRIKIVTTAAKTPPPASKAQTASAYRNIFVSYSHRDKAVVDICQHYAKAFGDRFLRDCVDLRAGQKWNPGLLALIEEADVFQLFWSTNARESEYVRQEVAHALRLNRTGFVRPTYWESEWPEPWNNDPDLSDLHFERLPFGNKLIDPPAGPESSPTHGQAATSPDIGDAPIVLGNASTDTIRISPRLKVETQMAKQTTAMSEEKAVPLAKGPESTKVKQAPAPLPKGTTKMARYGAPPTVAAPMWRAECRHEDAEDWYEEKDCEAGPMPLRMIFSIVMGLCSGALAWFYSNQAELQDSFRHSITLGAVGIGLGIFFGFFFFRLLPKGFKKVVSLALCVGLCAATWWIITRFFH